MRLDAIGGAKRLWRWGMLAVLVLILAACSGETVDTVTSTLPVDDTDGPGTPSTNATPSTSTTVPEIGATTYLVWTSGGLTDEMVARLTGQFDVLSVVTGDAAPLEVGDGRVVPLDAFGFDIDAHAAFDPDGETSGLVDGTVLLSETSASFRGVDVGDSLRFGGAEFKVAGVVSDYVVGAAEVVFSKNDPTSPISNNRFALIQTDIDRPTLVALIEAMNDGDAPARIKAEGETPWLRYADGVLPQIFIKLALGEFSYAADSGPELVQDELFVSENIVTTDLPILGRVTCHKVVIEMVTGALNQLAAEGLSHLIDPSEFAGCWNPRFIRTITGTPAGVSRHSWGAALDINATSNRLGAESTQDPRLVEIMTEWGFLWGGDWTIPDAMHFEYAIPPGQ